MITKSTRRVQLGQYSCSTLGMLDFPIHKLNRQPTPKLPPSWQPLSSCSPVTPPSVCSLRRPQHVWLRNCWCYPRGYPYCRHSFPFHLFFFLSRVVKVAQVSKALHHSIFYRAAALLVAKLCPGIPGPDMVQISSDSMQSVSRISKPKR